jgi:hypothetical protein
MDQKLQTMDLSLEEGYIQLMEVKLYFSKFIGEDCVEIRFSCN